MSKYIIDIPNGVEWIIVTCRTKVGFLTRDFDFDSLEELNSDYINEHFGDLQDEAYHRGLAEGKKAFDLLDAERDSEYHRGLSEGNDIGYKDGVKDGQNEAWECAKKLFSSMADSDIEKVFPIEWNNGGFYALMNLQPQEAIAKLKTYEEKEKQKADDKIKVRDEVIWTHDESVVIIVTSVYTVDGMEWCDGVCRNGRVYTILTKNARKTGRHFDIASILKEMQS